MGRFINKDPWPGDLQQPLTLNSYAYVSNNPVNRVDPEGLAESAPSFTFEKERFFYSQIQDILRRCKGRLEACMIKVNGNDLLEAIKRLFRRGNVQGINNIDDILRNPKLLSGKTPQEIEGVMANTPGWYRDPAGLGQGSQAGQGTVFREVNAQGNLTGRGVRWHPGGGHHGPDPYWTVSSPEGGAVRVGPQFP